jgi:hypothetical protein
VNGPHRARVQAGEQQGFNHGSHGV